MFMKHASKDLCILKTTFNNVIINITIISINNRASERASGRAREKERPGTSNSMNLIKNETALLLYSSFDEVQVPASKPK